MTPIKLPKLIFGTSALGNLYTELSEEIKTEIVKECIAHSSYPLVFDSAGKYGAGLALEMLGKIFEKLNVSPDKIILSNKLGWMRTPLLSKEPTFEPGVWAGLKNDAEQLISYDGILKCFEQGNDILKNKYVPQLLSVHDPDEYLSKAKSGLEYDQRFYDIIEAYRALTELKKQGKAKAIGVGAKDWKVIQKIANEVSLDWVMFANSMTIMNHPLDLIHFMNKLHSKEITIINSAIFQSGFLIGGEYYDYVKIEPNTSNNLQKFKWREQFYSICAKHNTSPMEACVHFALNAPGVSSISLNTAKPAHVKKNVASVDAIVPDVFYLEMKKQRLIEEYCTFI
jgi:D-threo-aldose 1-dehydrogenase